MQTSSRSPGVLLTVALAACGSDGDVGASAWCVAPPGVPSVASRVQDGRAFRLAERWRVGTEEGRTFTQPNQPVASPGGRVAVPDPSVSAVFVLEADGSWTGDVARVGEGPGEVRWPVAVEWASEDRLLVFDAADGTLVEVDVAGDSAVSDRPVDREVYGRIFRSGQLGTVQIGGDGSVYLALPGERQQEPPPHVPSILVRAGPGQGVDTLLSTTTQAITHRSFAGWNLPGAPRPVVAAASGGAVALGGEDGRYRVRLLDSGLRDSLIVCLDREPAALRPSERGQGGSPAGQEMDDVVRALMEAVAASPAPETLAPYAGLFFGAGGRLWVVVDRPDPAALMAPPEGALHDIFRGDGAYEGRVRAPAGVILFGEGGGKVYGMARDALDQIEIVAYELIEAE